MADANIQRRGSGTTGSLEGADSTRRRPGRPRGRSDARARILAAATEEFAERGYDGATIRGIAARAGVDSALVHHYFGGESNTKADLFAATIDFPLRPDHVVPMILAGPREHVGSEIVGYVLGQLEDPATRKRAVALMRSALGNRLATPLVAGFLQRELVGRVAAQLGTPDAELRASLVASQIAGLIVARYVARLPALVDASVAQLVERVGPTLQRYLVEEY